jgi:hypothetical protein
MEVGPWGKGTMVPNFLIKSQSSKNLYSGVSRGAESKSGTGFAPPALVSPLWRWASRVRAPWFQILKLSPRVVKICTRGFQGR